MKHLIFLALLMFTFASCDDDIIILNTSFSTNGQSLIVTNNDDFTYYKGTITINHEFTHKFESIWSKVPDSFPLHDFYNNDGEYFNPYSTKVIDVSISCQNAHENACFASGTF